MQGPARYPGGTDDENDACGRPGGALPSGGGAGMRRPEGSRRNGAFECPRDLSSGFRRPPGPGGPEDPGAPWRHPLAQGRGGSRRPPGRSLRGHHPPSGHGRPAAGRPSEPGDSTPARSARGVRRHGGGSVRRREGAGRARRKRFTDARRDGADGFQRRAHAGRQPGARAEERPGHDAGQRVLPWPRPRRQSGDPRAPGEGAAGGAVLGSPGLPQPAEAVQGGVRFAQLRQTPPRLGAGTVPDVDRFPGHGRRLGGPRTFRSRGCRDARQDTRRCRPRAGRPRPGRCRA